MNKLGRVGRSVGKLLLETKAPPNLEGLQSEALGHHLNHPYYSKSGLEKLSKFGKKEVRQSITPNINPLEVEKSCK